MGNYKLGWQNIFGHETKIERLKKNIAENKFPHALIFSGIEGIGKKKIATACAAALLCENPENGEPCGVCPNCKLMAGGSHPDFYIVAPEETKTRRNIKIGQIRALQNEVALRPINSDVRVVIIDGAEFMNGAAANCLLKTLEEPPGQTIFILTTANRAGLLMTVRSRCVTINFDRLPEEKIFSELIDREIEPDKAKKISVIAGGSFGRALNLAESGGYEIREEVLNLIEKICAEEFTNEDIFTKGAQISDWSRENFFDFVNHFQKIFRDIFLLDQSELYNPDFKDRLSKIKISEKRLSAMIAEGVTVQRRLKSNANLRLLAEAYLMKLKQIVKN